MKSVSPSKAEQREAALRGTEDSSKAMRERSQRACKRDHFSHHGHFAPMPSDCSSLRADGVRLKAEKEEMKAQLDKAKTTLKEVGTTVGKLMGTLHFRGGGQAEQAE